MTAASTTWRARGPMASCVLETGMMPLRLRSPWVGRTPTSALAEAGARMEWTVSEAGPSRSQLRDDEGVLARLRALQRQGAAGGRKVGGIVVVLENDGHAVQRAELSAMGEAGIQEVGRGQRTSVQGQDGIELRSLLVIGRDAVEVSLDELVAGQAVIAERLLDLRNRRLLNPEVGGEGGGGRGCKASGHGKDVLFHHVSFVESVTARPERRSGTSRRGLDDVSA